MMDLVKQCLICQQPVSVNIEKDASSSRKPLKLCSQQCKQHLQYCLGFAHGVVLFQVLYKLCEHVDIQTLPEVLASTTFLFKKDFASGVHHSPKVTVKKEVQDLPQSDEDVRDLKVFFETQTAKDHTTVGTLNRTMGSLTDALSCSDSEGETTVDLVGTETGEEENDQQVNDQEKMSNYPRFSVADQALTEHVYKFHSSETDSTHDLNIVALKEDVSSQNQVMACKKTRTKWVKSNFKCNQCNRHFHSETYLHNHVQRLHMNKHITVEENSHEKSLENKVLVRKRNTNQYGNKYPSPESMHHQTQFTHAKTPTAVKCDMCGLAFSHKIHLKQHKQSSHHCKNKQGDKTAFVCEHCNKECLSKKSLLHHIRLMHSTQLPSDCKVCGKTYRNTRLCREHMRTVHRVRAVGTKTQETLLQCTFCSQTFVLGSHQQITNHLQERHAQETAPTLACDMCGAKFKRKFTLNYHMKNTHSVGVPDNEAGINLQREKMHPCHKCGKTLSKNSMRRHMLMFHSKHVPVDCKVCDKKLKSALHLECHKRSHRTLPSRVCHICGANLKTDQGLKSHLAAHKGVKSHVCDICGTCFVRRTSWRRHIRQHADTTFQCDLCVKAFTTDYALHSHLLSAHQRGAYFDNRLRSLEQLGYAVDKEAVTRHLNHLCVICGEMLINGKCLIHPANYMLTFQCHKCEVTAKHIEFFCHHLKRHNNPAKMVASSSSRSAESYIMSSSISDRGEATMAYACKVCNKSFQRREYVSHHMKQHQEKAFSCPVCDKMFTYKCNMKSHLLTHTQDKPFTCEICHKSFKRQDVLRCHARVHDPNRSPFKCHLCGKGLTRKQYLQKHYKQVHPEVQAVPAL